MARALTPGEIARTLFGIDPDRDERASQLCMETLLTLSENEYAAPARLEDLRGPKRRQFAVRCLALSENFLDGEEEGRVASLAPQAFGAKLAAGEDLQGSANLGLARDALQGLIDPSTHQGQPGGWLLRPFHESLLWFDARRRSGRPWAAQQVYMRGSGVTLARMLCDAGTLAGPEASESGARAVAAMRSALQSDSPLAKIATVLEAALPLRLREASNPETAEQDAWQRGGEDELAELNRRVCRHAEGVMLQGTASAPSKLWQLRTALALDLAIHVLRTSWDRLAVPESERFLLLAFDGPPRRENRVRQRSERSYIEARQRLRQATVATLADEMRRIAREDPHPQWADELAPRKTKLADVLDALADVGPETPRDEFERLARLAAAEGDYGRASEGFRVLLDTVGMLTGTGAYRYLTAPPELLAALVGALSARMPMTSAEFFAAIRNEWGLMVDEAAGTRLAAEIDGAALQRNGRRAEARMAEAGLAVALSDRTVIVGERAKREPA